MYSTRNSQKNRRLGNVGLRRIGVAMASNRARMHNRAFARDAAAALGQVYNPPPYIPPRDFKRAKTLDQQVKALIASKKREAADVTRTVVGMTVTQMSCLTSSTDLSTAASGTGLLDCDCDEVLINHVRLKGRLTVGAVLDLDPVGNVDFYVRKLVVWFNKPLLVASAAGTLPPITEVLITDAIESMYVTAAANGGRFVVLSDRKWNMGTNTYQAVTAVGHARVSGRSQQFYDYIVKVNKKCKFVASSASGSNAGGHYDSDVAAGRIDRGLLVVYTQVGTITGGQSLSDTNVTRLNYTG